MLLVWLPLNLYAARSLLAARTTKLDTVMFELLAWSPAGTHTSNLIEEDASDNDSRRNQVEWRDKDHTVKEVIVRMMVVRANPLSFLK